MRRDGEGWWGGGGRGGGGGWSKVGEGVFEGLRAREGVG